MNRKWRIVYRFQLQPNLLRRQLNAVAAFQVSQVGFVVNINFFSDIAMKVPAHEFERVVECYCDVIRLTPIGRDSSGIFYQGVVL